MNKQEDLCELKHLRENQQDDMEANGRISPAGKAAGFWARVTIEPVLAGGMMAIFMAQTSLQTLYLHSACSVDLGYSADVCAAGGGSGSGAGAQTREAEVASQELVSSINVSRGFVGALISTVVLLFLGPWSDCSRRRKPLLIVSLLGMVVTSFNVLLIVTFPGLSTIWVLYLVQIPMSAGGNFTLLLTAGFSYVGDVCNATGRNVTMVMGSNRAVVQCASVLGCLVGPLMFRYFGFYGVFPIVFILQVSALVFVLWRVRDVQVNTTNQVSVLDVRLPVAAVRCLLAPRRHHRRAVVLLMILTTLADRLIMGSEALLLFMWVRNKYNWNDLTFGTYVAYRNTVSLCGTLLILKVLKARLGLSDGLVGALSAVSLAAASASFIVAPSTLVVFLIPFVGIISQGSQVVAKPIVNQQIESTEQGKIYSVLGAVEQAFQMAILPLLSLLYSRTVTHFPDAWLLPCISAAIVQMSAYLIARRLIYIQTAKPSDEPGIHGMDDTNQKPESTNEDNENFCAQVKLNVKEIKNINEINSFIDVDVVPTRKVEKKSEMLNKSTEILKRELDNELESILKSVDESVLIHNGGDDT